MCGGSSTSVEGSILPLFRPGHSPGPGRWFARLEDRGGGQCLSATIRGPGDCCSLTSGPGRLSPFALKAALGYKAAVATPASFLRQLGNLFALSDKFVSATSCCCNGRGLFVGIQNCCRRHPGTGQVTPLRQGHRYGLRRRFGVFPQGP